MTVPVNAPALSVKLFKTNLRAANDTFDVEIELNLTEGSTVTTHKAINSPNGGFTIRTGANLINGLSDSAYGIVEPMDVIEIRMSRNGPPMMIMRGVVTDVSMDETMGSDGKPSRSVTITGGDYGAFFRMYQIMFLKGTSVDDWLRGAGQFMLDKFGIPYVELTAGAFVIYLINGVINPFIAGLSNKALKPIQVDASCSDNSDKVFPQGFNANPDGTIWHMLQREGNLGPFYEAIFDDNEDDSTLIYRKPAFKKLNANGGDEYIFETSSTDTLTIEPNEITAVNCSRSENNVANFFYVRAPRGNFLTAQESVLNSIVGDGSRLHAFDHTNCDKTVYGLRPMTVDTQHGHFYVRGEAATMCTKEDLSQADYISQQIEYLKASNIDNVVFESGSIRCNGHPDYRPGRYFEIAWGNGCVSTGYIVSVTHTFETYRGYTCTLQYTRGTGFANRLEADNPYFFGKGVYE